MQNITGTVWCFGNNLSTDVLHPPEFFSLDPERVKQGLLHKYDPSIQPRLQPNDIFIGGRNFGCGSSRETSIRSLLLNKIGAIIAIDYARIFFRNATNNGVPCLLFQYHGDWQRIHTGQHLTLCFTNWQLINDKNEKIELMPVSPFIKKIWQAGGLLNQAKLEGVGL